MAMFKQKCPKCRKNYVIVSGSQRYVFCYECQKPELKGEIKDPAIKALFNIPEECYMENSFLRNIKSSYLKFGKLSEKQIAAFKKTVEKILSQKTKND